MMEEHFHSDSGETGEFHGASEDNTNYLMKNLDLKENQCVFPAYMSCFAVVKDVGTAHIDDQTSYAVIEWRV